MLGLFVKRHFEAVSLFHESYLVYVMPVAGQKKKFDFEIERGTNNAEIIVYYRDFKRKVPIIQNIAKGIKYITAVNKGINILKNEGKDFDFIHVHILTRLGLWGLWYKLTRNIPYGITEHWSRYQPVTGNYKGFLRKIVTKHVVKKASFVSTVTDNLRKAMVAHGLKNNNYFVLPNVVPGEFIATKQRKTQPKKVFIHVSTFEDKSKNISGIIKVAGKLEKLKNDFIIKLVGDGEDFAAMKSLAEQTVKSPETLEFTGILTGNSLVEEMANAEALIVFSNYENFPVVINEALTIGLPVIATNVGGISETINSDNGILLKAGDEEALLKSITDIAEGKLSFDREKIRNLYGNKYSYEAIGKILSEKYSLLTRRG